MGTPKSPKAALLRRCLPVDCHLGFLATFGHPGVELVGNDYKPLVGGFSDFFHIIECLKLKSELSSFNGSDFGPTRIFIQLRGELAAAASDALRGNAHSGVDSARLLSGGPGIGPAADGASPGRCC